MEWRFSIVVDKIFMDLRSIALSHTVGYNLCGYFKIHEILGFTVDYSPGFFPKER